LILICPDRQVTLHGTELKIRIIVVLDAELRRDSLRSGIIYELGVKLLCAGCILDLALWRKAFVHLVLLDAIIDEFNLAKEYPHPHFDERFDFF